jgi:hypothetical protein
MIKICLNWFGKRLAPAVVILASGIVQACSSGISNTSNVANSRNLNLNQTQKSTISPQCDPNYSGCVPIASDVDCAGGSGDGPAYVKGPVKVIGKDIYRLDRDGDGIGCE